MTGKESHVVLCETLSGTDDEVTYDAGDSFIFVKAKTPKIRLKFNSKNKHNAYHKSRLSPTVKFVQSYNVSVGKMEAKDTNTITEWITESYFNKKKIYLLVDFPNSDGDFVKKSWYDDTGTKLYYLKGILKFLDITQIEGRVWKIALQFEESWKG